jgi:hypothetical protein
MENHTWRVLKSRAALACGLWQRRGGPADRGEERDESLRETRERREKGGSLFEFET